MKKQEEFVYVKFGPEEANSFKKRILQTEINALRTLQKVKNYHELRNIELGLKEKLQKLLKETRSNIAQLKKILPPIKTPSTRKKRETSEEKDKSLATKQEEVPIGDNIEAQLREIQEKLRKISE